VGDGSRWGLRVVYSFERSLLGTGGGIQKAAPHLVGDTFVVMNADILLEVDLREVLRFHREKQGSVTLVLREDPEVERYGVIEIDADCRVREFLGRLGLPKRPRKRLMFTGLHVLEPTVFSYMPVDRPAFSITDVYVEMIRAGETVLGYEMKGFWTDLGTRERYRLMERMVARKEISLEGLVSRCCRDRIKTGEKQQPSDAEGL
jgi:NDP-sugar pyrophosphorylase family protein